MSWSSSRSVSIADLGLRGELLFEQLSGAHEAGADGALGDFEDGGDLARVQLLDGGERERLAKFFGERVDEAVHRRLLVCAKESLFGIFVARGEFEQDCFVQGTPG